METTGKKIAILGFGREWASTLRYLLDQWVDSGSITILDKNTITIVPEGIMKRLWGDYLDNLDQYDILVGSPGISPYLPEIAPYRSHLTSQSAIFFERYQGRVIGVTATKGKSTTSTLIAEVIWAAGISVELVGNIGKPVLDCIDFDHPPEYVVYELSSYMLEYCRPRCYISVLGNIYPDHLWYHEGFENYRDAKLSILQGATYRVIGSQVQEYIETIPTETTIIPDSNGYHIHDNELYQWDTWLMKIRDIQIIGEHNARNILSVFAVGHILGISTETIRNTCSTFRGLPHRLEYIWTFRAIRFYDDAISTTPESTLAGISALSGQVDTIFLGGEDRGYDFTELAKVLEKESIRNIVLFPDTGARILPLLDPEKFHIFETRSMEAAVKFAFDHTRPWSICLLSTASPSYSLWKNFEEKWDLFQKYIRLHG